jgi:hypothetical protein
VGLRKPFSLLTDNCWIDAPSEPMTDRHHWVLRQLRSGVELTRDMVEDQFGIGEKQAKRALAVLTNCGMVRFVRGPRPGHYELVTKSVPAEPADGPRNVAEGGTTECFTDASVAETID